MAASHYERLTALDAAFLEIEDENCPMHVGAVGIFDAGPLTRSGGGFDIERFTKYVESVLTPRYRQRLARMPLSGDPVWVDDARFNLHYHVRHMSLPHPGDDRLLKRLAGHAMSLPLDRSKPLWELWVVEGLARGRFAVITKTHHCMVDGVGTSDLMAASMQTRADASVSEPTPWKPRPVPSALGMAVGELHRRAGLGLSALGAAADAIAHPLRAVAAVREGVEGLGETLGASLHRSSPTPFNLEIGPHRRFDWLRYDLADVKQVKNRLGATVNDVVLANVAGALRSFLIQRGEDVYDLDFRAMVPVNVRTEDESGQLGNRVATVAVPLPLGEPDPRRRLAQVARAMGEVKASRQVSGMETMQEISEWGLAWLFTQLARLAAISRPFNVVVTNVPGPQIQAYLLGSPLREAYPLVPLYKNQALGIALFSYHGGVFWGLNADWDALPDLHVLVEALALDFQELKKAAQV
jgi:WS/DGAT/MGAT family acyltransferase